MTGHEARSTRGQWTMLVATTMAAVRASTNPNPASATVTVEHTTRAFVFDMEKLRKLVETDDLVAVAIHRVVGKDLAQKLQARNADASATQAA